MLTLNSLKSTVSSASAMAFVSTGSIGSTRVAPSDRIVSNAASATALSAGSAPGSPANSRRSTPHPGAAQRSPAERRPVVARQPRAGDVAERRPQHVQGDRRVSDGPRHRSGRVLAGRDRDDPVLGDEADRRLESDDRVAARRTDDRAIRLGADGERTQVGGRRDRRARARAARVPGEAVGVPRRPAASAPAVEVEPRILDRRRDEAPEVGPLGQVGLAQDHGAGIAQPGDQARVAWDPAADQGERAGRRLHAVAGRDVVLDQDGDPVEGSARRPARRWASRRAAIAGASGLVSMTAWRTGSRRSIRRR